MDIFIVLDEVTYGKPNVKVMLTDWNLFNHLNTESANNHSNEGYI